MIKTNTEQLRKLEGNCQLQLLSKYFYSFFSKLEISSLMARRSHRHKQRSNYNRFLKTLKEYPAVVSFGSPCIILSTHVSSCHCVSQCISQHTHINCHQGSSWLFRVLHDSVQRHRGIFWLHLHVKWSALLCGHEAPPDSPSPVACQSEPASSPHSSLPAGVGHDSTVRNILRSCQSLHCRTRVNLLKSSGLARTNTTHSLPSARQTKARTRY